MKGVVVPIVGTYEGSAFRRAEQDIQRLGNQARRQSSGVSKFGSAFKGAFAGGVLGGGAGALAGIAADVVSLAVTFAKDGVASAMAEEKALAALERQVRATGNSFNLESVTKFVDDLQYATNVSDSELFPALQSLTAATGSLSTAQGLLTSVIDASVGSGKSLETVTTAVAKAANGNVTSLKRLFPALSSTALATKDLTVIQGELNRLYGGAAATAVGTAAGQMENLKIAIDEAGEALGKGLVAGFTGVSDGTKTFVDLLRSSQPQLEQFGKAIGTLALGLGALVIQFNGTVLGFRLLIAGITRNEGAAQAAADDFGKLTDALFNAGEAYKTTATDINGNPIVAVVTAVDPYGAALGAGIAPFSKVIGMILDDIEQARKDAEDSANAAEEEAARAEAALRERIRKRTQTLADNARAQVQAAKDEIASFRGIVKDYRSGVQEFGAVSSLQAEAGVPITGQMITDNMRQRLSVIRKFAVAVKDLQGKGLPNSVLLDVINQGPFEGLRYAEALLANKETIGTVKDLATRIASQGGVIGNIAAEATTGTTMGALQAATSVNVQAGGIQITVNGEVTAKTVKEIRQAVSDALRGVGRESKASRKTGARG
jgi:hypothetical protein